MPEAALETAPGDRKRKPAWPCTPPLPLRASPHFGWPPRPFVCAKWVLRGWLPLSKRSIILALPILSWLYFHPALERCREFAPDWIAQTYLRNLVLERDEFDRFLDSIDPAGEA